MVENFEEIKIKTSKIPNFPKKKILYILLIAAILVFIFTGLYTVDPEEVGVIQRFGKYLKTTEPGLHFKIPFGVDMLTKVPVRKVMKEEFGFRTLKAGVKTQYSRRDYSIESLMLTGDLNIADVEWIVQYRIKDPVKFLFKIRNVEETIRDVSEAVMREVVGDRSVDEVIVLSRKEIADEVNLLLQKQLNRYNAGIEIVTINLQNVNPPDKVKPAFNEVNSAKQEKEKIVNEAWQKYNQIIPEARGKAKRTIEEAEGYAVDRVNRAKGDAERFNQVYTQYKKAKDVTKKRLYLETMEKILPEIEKIYIVDDKQKGILPLLNLDKGGK
ncbi:MAG: FtsH protease activity modulator HflK [Candidatus Cloacimonadota bacterium]|nr:MAG: FtsH protease activity modulator HflK [Candidatus Cloacimonadota bacterium]